METLAKRIEKDGFAIVPGVLPIDEVEILIEAVHRVPKSSAHKRGGLRNVLNQMIEVRLLANSEPVLKLVKAVLGPNAFVVNGILFDKTPQANWKVPWHQDVTIALQNRMEIRGWGPWSLKDGVHNVQPSVELMKNMLAVRIHLDDCDETNGALRVVPGSHRSGRLTEQQIESMCKAVPGVPCLVGRGGALLIRPLLLHASSAAQSPGHRRVIHLEFAASTLPSGLRWFSES